jgi:hypothetical protein
MAKWGSLGKIHERNRHGRMASSLNQRQIVLSLIVATSPLRRASAASSAMLQRESARPKRHGSSQASALISMTSSGGKSPGTARAWTFLQPGQAFLKEAFAPVAHDFAPGMKVLGNLLVLQAFGGE